MFIACKNLWQFQGLSGGIKPMTKPEKGHNFNEANQAIKKTFIIDIYGWEATESI